MITMRLTVLLLALGLVLAACSSSGDADGSWTLTDFRTPAGELASPVGVEITLIVEDGSFSGNAGCNQYFGDASVESGVSQVGTTMMMCENNVMIQEDLYVSLLTQIDSIEVDGDTLTASDTDGQVILVYAAV
jgi:heat shock protein HslJ